VLFCFIVSGIGCICGGRCGLIVYNSYNAHKDERETWVLWQWRVSHTLQYKEWWYWQLVYIWHGFDQKAIPIFLRFFKWQKSASWQSWYSKHNSAYGRYIP